MLLQFASTVLRQIKSGFFKHLNIRLALINSNEYFEHVHKTKQRLSIKKCSFITSTDHVIVESK